MEADSSPEAGSPVSEKRDEEERVERPNPLTTILTMSELFEFASQEVSPSQIFQCTIIRDKRGIDRSLYPTYFMYLQMIIGEGDSWIGGEARDKVMKHLPATAAGSDGGRDSRPTRQVFLLCGRRRKKSKTYLIGLDPFDISRINCVAKLKSNVLGTHVSDLQSQVYCMLMLRRPFIPCAVTVPRRQVCSQEFGCFFS